MARGWESKSVAQQQEAEEFSSAGAHSLTPEEATIFRQRQGLLLSRKAVWRRLETAQHPRQRQMLETALADLENRLAMLGMPTPEAKEPGP
jgi:hypothetical protein